MRVCVYACGRQRDPYCGECDSVLYVKKKTKNKWTKNFTLARADQRNLFRFAKKKTIKCSTQIKFKTGQKIK